MKILLSAILLNAFTIVCFAQNYLGTYDQVPPPSIARNPEVLKQWKMTKQEIKITPEHITFYFVGHPDAGGEDYTFSEHGQFLLATRKSEDETVFDPIYIFDKDTIFARGDKFVRVKNSP